MIYFGFFKAPVADMIAVLTPDALVVMVTTGGLIIFVVIMIGFDMAAFGCESHFDFLLCSITEKQKHDMCQSHIKHIQLIGIY